MVYTHIDSAGSIDTAIERLFGRVVANNGNLSLRVDITLAAVINNRNKTLDNCV